MIPLPLLLTTTAVRVGVFGEGRLCFESGSSMAFAPAATLTTGPKGLLADAAGRPVFPHIALSGPAFSVTMNGTVSVAGHSVGRLVLQRADGGLGHPGDAGFGVIQVNGGNGGQGTGSKSSALVPSHPSPDPSSPVLIAVRPRTEVDADRILLKDLADLSGDAKAVAALGRTDLGAMPALGAHRGLSRYTVTAALRDAGFAEGAYTLRLPPDVTVGRKGQTVDPKTILDAAIAEAKLASGGDEPTPLPGPVLAPVLAPLGDLKVETTSTRNGDRVQIEVAVRVDGFTVARRTLAYKIRLDGVKTGDALRIAVACGGAAVETDAKAKSGGVVGDTIQIVTADGTILTATVTGTGKAEVKL